MLNRLVRSLSAPLLAVFLGSCASYGAYQTVPMPDQTVELGQPSKARLYVIRANQTVWQRAPLHVYDGEELLAQLKPGTFLCWERNPTRFLGRLVLERSRMEGDVEGLYDSNLESGDVRYVVVSLDNSADKLVTERLDAETGKALVAKSKAASVR
jgi:hypothetical protein